MYVLGVPSDMRRPPPDKHIPGVLATLDDRADPVTGLFGIDGTAADDSAELAYQTPTQVLA